MEIKIATKLTPRIVEFVKDKSGLNYVRHEGYFHYPNFDNFNGFKNGYHGDYVVNEGYEEVTEQEFVNYFNDFEFGERVLCDDGIERIFLFKKDNVYYCVSQYYEDNFNSNNSILLLSFKSIQKLEQKIQEPTKEEKLNKIIEQLKELL